MRKAHARPSKRYVCDGCKRRIRWASQVHRVGRHGQLTWCDECYRGRGGFSQDSRRRGARVGLEPSGTRPAEFELHRNP